MTTALRGSPVVAAPGKVFLVGEYGVLEGGNAVLAAVNREAVGEFIPALDPGSPLVAEAVRVTLAALGDEGAALPAGSVWVDSSAFAGVRDRNGNSRKLGLGSSAATAACTVGAVLEMAGTPIADHRQLAFSLAESAHRAWQGGVGSGADVAAAVYGGVLQYSRPGGGTPVVHGLPNGLASLTLTVFSTRTATSTTGQIRAMRAFAQRAPAHYASLLTGIHRAADAFVEAIVAPRPPQAIAAIRAAGDALAALGAAAEVDIVTAPFARAAAIAADLGGAAKPSGAGGGDVGVAVFLEPSAARAFADRAGGAAGKGEGDGDDFGDGFEILELSLDDKGLHRRSAGMARVEHNV
jgi:phosphomevalonate kinase